MKSRCSDSGEWRFSNRQFFIEMTKEEVHSKCDLYCDQLIVSRSHWVRFENPAVAAKPMDLTVMRFSSRYENMTFLSASNFS